ncbi:predicted protein [Plenodomus lingam JN3]|uniref:Predicted protein n=1 Tax=Leptosphaeria maculans (strain JN3 / isolate v23.1.3 / race Av1-4-5-6-7-8) TaxID=985895 RepID=E5A499_LEPMJ|nr:predicted protein [Plenodomus lingam JN3]CBX98444.1 predicted protein [Plenodomus lingam JN3]
MLLIVHVLALAIESHLVLSYQLDFSCPITKAKGSCLTWNLDRYSSPAFYTPVPR